MKTSPALLLLLACGAAGAQPVYRCADSSFSQAPCPGGERMAAPVGPTRSERAEARSLAEADAKLAAQLAAERRARDAQPAADAAGFHPAEVKKKTKPSKSPSPRPAAD